MAQLQQVLVLGSLQQVLVQSLVPMHRVVCRWMCRLLLIASVLKQPLR